MGDFVAVNRRNYVAYREELAAWPGVRFISYDERESNNYQYVVVEWDEAVTGISRDDVLAILHAENVLARRYFFPGCHRMEPYRSLSPRAGERLPQTERLAARVIALPTGTSVTRAEVDGVCAILRNVLKHATTIRARLRHGDHGARDESRRGSHEGSA